MKAMRLGTLAIVCLFFCHLVSAQTASPPGNVSSGLILWLDGSDVNADGTTPASGSTLSTWKDKSGTGHNATSFATKLPIFNTNMINGHPSITFTKLSITDGTGYIVSGVDIRAITNPKVTVFTVYRQGNNFSSYQQAVWGDDNGDWDRFFFTKFNYTGAGPNDGGVSFGPGGSNTVAIVRNAGTAGLVQLLTASYNGLVSGSSNLGPTDGSAIYFNGKVVTTFTDRTHPSNAQTALRIGLDGDDNFFDGEIAEMIVYNRQLTDCEIQAVNRYLSQKYGAGYDVINNYSYASPSFEVKGVGNFSTSCITNVITSASSSIATISNPAVTTINNNLTFANDGAGFATSGDAPSGFSKRIAQLWRVDQTGSVGTVDICFDLTGLGLDVSDPTNFVLLGSSSTSMAAGSVIALIPSISGNNVCFSGITLTKGQYFTLAVLKDLPVAAITSIADDTGPSNTDFITSDATLIFSGTATPGSTVTLKRGTTQIATVTTNAYGSWSYDYTATTLAENTYTFSATATLNGGTGTASPITVKVDRTAPATPPAPVLSGGNQGRVNNTMPTITGTAEANSAVTIYDNGVAIGTTTTDASGNWSYTFATALAESSHPITVKATDLAGNISAASPSTSVIVDITAPAPPSAPALTGGNQGRTNNNKPTVTGTAEANSTVTIYDDGVAVGTTTTDASGNWSYTFSTALIDGSHPLTATATDLAGNISTASPSTTIIVDTTPPSAPSAPAVTGSNDGKINNNTPTIKGTAEPGTTVTIYDNGVAVGTTTVDANGNWSYTFSPALADGSHTISATAMDLAGNISQVSPSTTVIVDTRGPSVVISTTSTAFNAPFTATITFSKPVSAFSLSDIAATNATLSGLTKVNDSVYTVLVTPVSASQIKLSLAAGVTSDLAGNSNAASNIFEASASFSATIDQVYPVPAKAILNIHFTGAAPLEGRVILIDMAGQRVYDQVTQLRGQLLTINVSAFASGTYVLKVQAENYQYHTKIIIAHQK